VHLGGNQGPERLAIGVEFGKIWQRVRWAPIECTYFGATTVEEFETLKRLIDEAGEDIQKAEGGNKAAGTRVRKSMQDIKNTAQDVRKKVLDLRSDSA